MAQFSLAPLISAADYRSTMALFGKTDCVAAQAQLPLPKQASDTMNG